MTPQYYYSEEGLCDLDREVGRMMVRYARSQRQLVKVDALITEIHAREYLQHGVMRRQAVLHRCLEKIFEIFYHRRVQPLQRTELTELSIVLHALFGNVFGLLDNLAWILDQEKHWKLPRRKIGLYNQHFQTRLQPPFQEYLSTRADWHNEHLKEYRDSISHRIPAYVPPFAYDEDGNVLNPAPFFSASLFTEKSCILHSQVLADINTVYEVIEKYIEYEFSNAHDPNDQQRWEY